MEVRIIHELRFGKDGILDDLVHDFLEGLIIKANNNDSIIQKLDLIMATSKQQFDDILSRIDVATSNIGAGIAAAGQKIAGLEDVIKGLGLDAATEEQILTHIAGVATSLESSATALDAIAKDSSDPVPVSTTTTAPVEETTTAPVEETTTAPVEETTTAPVEETTTAPVEETTTAPVEETTTQFPG